VYSVKQWWRKAASFLIVAALISSSLPAGVSAATAPDADPVLFDRGEPQILSGADLPSTGQIIVKFDKPEAASAVRALAVGGASVMSHSNSRMVIKLPDASTRAQALVAALRALPGVAYVENDEMMQVTVAPNDPYYKNGYLWGHERIGAEAAWDQVTAGGEPVVVAVIDTGVDTDHPDLQGRLLQGADFVTPNTTPEDDHGHGTHVSGTIAAVYNNGVGMTGVVGPANVKILPIKALDAEGRGATSKIAEAIQWAANNGADVINLSLGGLYTRTMEEAVRYAIGKGVVVVAAAGNEDDDTIMYAPAAVPGAVTVSALDDWDDAAYFSNWGDQVEMTAPGYWIWSTVHGDSYGYKSGTSMAAPHVAAVAALVKAAHPTYTRSDIQACLLSSLEPMAIGAEYGAGLVRANLAVACNAGTLDPKYALKLEGPDPDQHLAGLTTFTFDVRADLVASIQMKDETGAVLGTAQVTGDLTALTADLSNIADGPGTLQAVARNKQGQTVTTLAVPVTVDREDVTIKVMDQTGYPARSGYADLYVNESFQSGDRV
jgi:thermitase